MGDIFWAKTHSHLQGPTTVLFSWFELTGIWRNAVTAAELNGDLTPPPLGIWLWVIQLEFVLSNVCGLQTIKQIEIGVHRVILFEHESDDVFVVVSYYKRAWFCFMITHEIPCDNFHTMLHCFGNFLRVNVWDCTTTTTAMIVCLLMRNACLHFIRTSSPTPILPSTPPREYVLAPERVVCPPCHAGCLVLHHLHPQLCHRCGVRPCRSTITLHQVLVCVCFPRNYWKQFEPQVSF